MARSSRITKVVVEVASLTLEFSGIKVAGRVTQRDPGVTLDVSSGIQIMDSHPQRAGFALVGGN